MIHKKLEEVLFVLPADTLLEVRLFIQSPYFTHNSNVSTLLQLYDYILEFKNNNPHATLDKEQTAMLFFPTIPFVKGKKHAIDNLSSELFSIVKKFLGQKEMEKNQDFLEGLALSRFYRKNGFENRFFQTITSLRKKEDQKRCRFNQYYLNQYLIEEEFANYKGLNNTFVDDSNLTAKDRKLDVYYAILKFDQIFHFLNQQSKANITTTVSPNLRKFLWESSEPGEILDLPVIQLYKLAINLLENTGNTSDTEFFDLLDEIEEQLPFHKLKDLRAFQRTLLIRRYNQSSDKVNSSTLFSTYKDHLEKALLLYDNKITVHSFKNLAIFALKFKEYNWIEQFFNDYPPERICGTKYPFEIHSLRRADYHYYIGEYDRALELINYKAFEDPQSSIVADVLQIKIYFETENDILEYRLKSMDQKVRRTNLADSVKNRYYNFIKKTDKLIKYGGLAKDHKKLSKLKEELISMPDIIEREWLLEKTMEALGEETKTAVPE
ncbi:MAG: hypothetical protein R2792_07630 [Saprospiraceae bacterium]